MPVLIDSCFSEDDQEQICAGLETTLASLHPRLLPPIREIPAPLCDRPAGASAARSDPPHRSGLPVLQPLVDAARYIKPDRRGTGTPWEEVGSRSLG